MSDVAHITDLAPGYALGALSANERSLVDAHIAACGDCRADVMAMLGIAGTLPLACEEIAPPAGLKTRIVEAATAETRAGSALSSRSAAASRVTPSYAGPAPSAWRWSAALAVAASVVFGAIALDQAHQRAALQSQVDALGTQLGLTQRDNLALRRQSEDGRNVMVALASGTYWTMGPHADANGKMWRCTVVQPLMPGHNAMLLATVPEPPRGMAYQVWVGKKGSMRKAGMLMHGGMTMLDMAMPVRTGEMVAFSVEPMSGSAAPSTPYAMEIAI